MSDTDIDGDTGEAVVEPPTADSAPDAEHSGETDALLSRLRLIEDQPLEARAEAFAQVYDELQARLDSGETSRGNG